MNKEGKNPVALPEIARELALRAGFDDAGMAPVPEPGSAEDYQELGRLEGWVEAGFAGEMEYLKRRDAQGRLLRSSLRLALPWTRSVVVCAANYNSGVPFSSAEARPGTGWVARYALSGKKIEDNPDGGSDPTDYHSILLEKLRAVESQLREVLQAQGVEFESRCYVDTGPLIERVYARYAGIGWTGKNTCVINQGLGSWIFLGVIATSLEWPVPALPEIAADRCGSCTRCIDACPTQAIVGPRELDASRCIAYLTIEKKGAIAEDLRSAMGRHVFGCDICQEVCPWNRDSRNRDSRNPDSRNRASGKPDRSENSGNRLAPLTTLPEFQAREELVNPALEWLAGLDSTGFKRLFNGSPVERTRLKGLRRNVAIAMGNSGERKFLPQLEIWTAGEDEVLAEAARWAMKRLEG